MRGGRLQRSMRVPLRVDDPARRRHRSARVVSSDVLATDAEPDLQPTLRPTFRRQVRIDLPLYCQECNRRWNDPAERWLVYFTREEPPETSVYCPTCARREFGE
jgi:hypothetical protein